MISPLFADQFEYDADRYDKYKDQVKAYVSNRYEASRNTPISVYSICVGFQMKIGNIPQSALSYWLNEWGYTVNPSKGEQDRNHSVFIKMKKKFDR